MKHLALLLILLAVVLVASLAIRSARASADPTAPPITEGLRLLVLSGKSSDFGIDKAALPHGVWAIVMDTRYAEGPATTVALADGSASLYFGTGSGVIGGGAHEPVRVAAKAAILLAAKQLNALHSTEDFSLPAVGHTRFLVLTTHGVFGSDVILEESLGNNQHTLSPVFYGIQDVITALRQASGDAPLVRPN